MELLPINSNNTHYDFRIEVVDIPLLIRIDYNTRAATWYMEIYDEFEELLMGSRALVIGYNIFNNINIESLPDIKMLVINFYNTYEDPTITSLGNDVLITFRES